MNITVLDSHENIIVKGIGDMWTLDVQDCNGNQKSILPWKTEGQEYKYKNLSPSKKATVR